MSESEPFRRLVHRFSEEDSPALQVEWGLSRMLDAEGCKALQEDLEQFANPWETFRATEKLADSLPDEPGLYMFVWLPRFSFNIAQNVRNGNLSQILYIGQAGSSASGSGNTIRLRYSEYRKYLRGDPESLWTKQEPVTRAARLTYYFALRPLEFWCATIADRSKIGSLEKRLIKLINPPLNDRDRPKLRGRLSKSVPAF